MFLAEKLLGLSAQPFGCLTLGCSAGMAYIAQHQQPPPLSVSHLLAPSRVPPVLPAPPPPHPQPHSRTPAGRAPFISPLHPRPPPSTIAFRRRRCVQRRSPFISGRYRARRLESTFEGSPRAPDPLVWAARRLVKIAGWFQL